MMLQGPPKRIIPPVLDSTESTVPAHRLVLSADASRRTEAARAWLEMRRESSSFGGSGALILAPSRGAADDLLRASGAGWLGIQRLTLSRLAAELATPALARHDVAPVRGLALEALAARTLADTHQAQALEYFAPVVDAPGLPGTLARTLTELRSAYARPEQLDALGSRGRDLGRLLASFERRLEEHRLVDPAGLARLALEACETQHPLLDLPLLLLDVAAEHSVDVDLLRAVARRSPAVLATGLEGDEDGARVLVEILGPDAAVEPVDEGTADEARPTAGGRLERLRRHIFREKEQDRDEAPDETQDEEQDEERDEGLIFFAAPGEGRECIEIARRLHALARDGVPFDRCAVALRDPETYLPLIEEAFHRADIEAHFTRGTRRPDPAGRAFLALLACADEQLSASRFAEYLSLGRLPRADAFGAPPSIEEVPWVVPDGEQMVFKSLLPIPGDPEFTPESSSFEDTSSSSSGSSDPSSNAFDFEAPVTSGSLRAPRRWERLLVDAAVVRGQDRWRRRIDGVIKELELQLRGDGRREQRQRLEEELRELRALKRFALPLIEDLAGLAPSATWGERLEPLQKLAGRALADPDRVLEVLAELRPMAEVGPVSLTEVRRVLAERLSLLRTEPTRRRFGRVFVATLDELRGRSFHTVFLPGLAEGIFPRRAHEDPLLLDEDRRRLAEQGGRPMVTQEDRFSRERRLLRLAVGAAEEALITSYPSLDALHGRSRVPSFYALDLLRAAEGRLPELQRLERRATTTSSLRLGWPAPRDPALAVDEAEFDLATLTRWMEPAGPDRGRDLTGRGRYLLDTNPFLRRALRNRYSRWGAKWTQADGLWGRDEVTAKILKSQHPRERAYSPTALQQFAACPYRFYLHGLIRLRRRERFEPLEQMDPLTRGSLYHQVQFELLTLLKDRRLLPMQGRRHDPEYVETLHRLTDQCLDAVAERYEEELAPAIPRVWRSEVENLKLDLRGWIRARLAAAEQEPWVPTRFELAFGLRADDAHDPESSEQEVEIAGGRRLRGSVDLVEEDPQHRTLRITDHKTGRPRRPKGRRLYVAGGELLQPLLYSLVVEGLLDRPVESGRLYYATRRGGYQVLEAHLDEEARDIVDLFFQTVEGHLERGFLPAAPAEGACKFCDFRLVCGPNEPARTARKQSEALAGLRRLRQLP